MATPEARQAEAGPMPVSTLEKYESLQRTDPREAGMFYQDNADAIAKGYADRVRARNKALRSEHGTSY
jgi:hypothetical protein